MSLVVLSKCSNLCSKLLFIDFTNFRKHERQPLALFKEFFLKRFILVLILIHYLSRIGAKRMHVGTVTIRTG